MRRGIAMVWHTVSFVVAACLFFFFVLPRWPELTGDVSHTWGTVLRIVTGAVLGLTALPVVFTLLKSARPELGTPQLALSLRLWSIIGHILAGAMIMVAAIVEIWVSLDRAGQWLFGVYGAAAAIAVLSALAFYLAFVAELPPPPPKPLKPLKPKQQKKQKADRGESSVADITPAEDVVVDEATDENVADDDPGYETADPIVTSEADDAVEEADEPRRGLRNRRPSGKGRRGGVALSD